MTCCLSQKMKWRPPWFLFSAGLESCNAITKTNLVRSSLSQHWLCSVYLKEISQLCLKSKNEFLNPIVVVGWYLMLKWETLRKHDGWKRNFLWWRHKIETELNPFCTIKFVQKHILKSWSFLLRKRLNFETKSLTCNLPIDVSHEM